MTLTSEGSADSSGNIQAQSMCSINIYFSLSFACEPKHVHILFYIAIQEEFFWTVSEQCYIQNRKKKGKRKAKF